MKMKQKKVQINLRIGPDQEEEEIFDITNFEIKNTMKRAY